MRVLVVEDEEYLREFLRRALVRSKNTVDTASNGKDAFERAVSGVYDLIVLDIVLPKKNGLQVCKELREEGVKTPILMLSSQDSYAARIRGLDAGADDYMIKPFNYEELAARTRALTRRKDEIAPSILESEDVTLNQTAQRVELDGQELQLRPKEYVLLEYFMMNPNRAIAREELLQKVWGISSENTSNRLDVYIRHLRAKIDDHRKENLIQTIRGKGYLFRM